MIGIRHQVTMNMRMRIMIITPYYTRKWREAEENIRKQKLKEKRQKEREKLKEAIATPIDPLPERELCQYEQIREDIIRERKGAMDRFNFYEDLKKTKEEIGFIPKRFQDEKDI